MYVTSRLRWASSDLWRSCQISGTDGGNFLRDQWTEQPRRQYVGPVDERTQQPFPHALAPGSTLRIVPETRPIG